MKLIEVYNQGHINWFGYKYVFSYASKLNGEPHIKELELKSWIRHPLLNITKRKPNEDK